MYRKCVTCTENKNIVKFPSYSWFLLQFWSSTKTASNVFQYTSRLKVKQMVQAYILHKNNHDEHYANALLKFLKERAQKNVKPVTFVSADTKCKVLIGEP